VHLGGTLDEIAASERVLSMVSDTLTSDVASMSTGVS